MAIQPHATLAQMSPAGSSFILLHDAARSLKMGLPEDRSLYTSLDAFRRSPGCAPIQQVRYTIEQADPVDTTAQLVIAPTGAGRTTELSRLQYLLERNREEPTRVVWVELSRWVDMRRVTSILHVLRAITCSVEELVGEEGGFSRYLTELLRHQPVLKELGITDLGTFHYRMKSDVSARRKVDLVLRDEFQEYVRIAHSSIQAISARLAQEGISRLVVVVEGLDRVGRVDRPELILRGEGLDTPDSPWSRAILGQKKEIWGEWSLYEQSVERLLLDHAPVLQVPCHIVISIPGWINNIRAQLQLRWPDGVVEISGLGGTSERVFSALQDLIQKRVSGSVPELGVLWWASGGLLRDFLGLVQDCGTGMPAKQAVASLKTRYQRLWPLFEGSEGSRMGRGLWRAAERGFYVWGPTGLEKRLLWEEG